MLLSVTQPGFHRRRWKANLPLRLLDEPNRRPRPLTCSATEYPLVPRRAAYLWIVMSFAGGLATAVMKDFASHEASPFEGRGSRWHDVEDRLARCRGWAC
jgi:hypothetical protein